MHTCTHTGTRMCTHIHTVAYTQMLINKNTALFGCGCVGRFTTTASSLQGEMLVCYPVGIWCTPFLVTHLWNSEENNTRKSKWQLLLLRDISSPLHLIVYFFRIPKVGTIYPVHCEFYLALDIQCRPNCFIDLICFHYSFKVSGLFLWRARE